MQIYKYIITLAIIIILFKIIERILVSNWEISRIDKATGPEFEQFLCYKFQKMGYRVRHTGRSGDFGADLILYKGKEKIVVQAKRYRGKVDQTAVREAAAAVAYYKADRAIVVTNSTFTDAAISLAKSNHVELFNRDWIKRVTARGDLKNSLSSLTKEKEDNLYVLEFEYKRKISGGDENPTAAELSHLIDEYLNDHGYMVERY